MLPENMPEGEEDKKKNFEKSNKDNCTNSLVDKLKNFCISSCKSIDSKHFSDSIKCVKTMEDIADFIKSGSCKRIVVLCGAGISTSCGIPDFRSPDTGIFSNLENFNLPYPEALFHISFFKENPQPFYDFSKKIINNMTQAKPSLAHYFIKILSNKGLLARVYTQNIDGLEELAGIDKNLICFAHGTFKHAHCIDKFHENDITIVIEEIKNDIVPKCNICGSVVKPDIVFYGESLPKEFHNYLSKDVKNVDLLIIMGTSLTVQPFATIAEMMPYNTPRLLINKTKVWKFCVKPTNTCNDDENSTNSRSSSPDDYYMTKKMLYQDVFYMDTCDNGCKELAKLLGWYDELEDLYKTGHNSN